jgi:hypothetical protein
LTAEGMGLPYLVQYHKIWVIPSVAVGWNLHSEDFMANGIDK